MDAPGEDPKREKSGGGYGHRRNPWFFRVVKGKADMSRKPGLVDWTPGKGGGETRNAIVVGGKRTIRKCVRGEGGVMNTRSYWVERQGPLRAPLVQNFYHWTRRPNGRYYAPVGGPLICCVR